MWKEGGGHTFPFLAEKLLALDGHRERESVFLKDLVDHTPRQAPHSKIFGEHNLD